jgi:hypothetical protein
VRTVPQPESSISLLPRWFVWAFVAVVLAVIGAGAAVDGVVTSSHGRPAVHATLTPHPGTTAHRVRPHDAGAH